jgi:hypothetical protein
MEIDHSRTYTYLIEHVYTLFVTDMERERIFSCYKSTPMLSGLTATTAWRVLRLRMEEKASRYGG